MVSPQVPKCLLTLGARSLRGRRLDIVHRVPSVTVACVCVSALQYNSPQTAISHSRTCLPLSALRRRLIPPRLRSLSCRTDNIPRAAVNFASVSASLVLRYGTAARRWRTEAGAERVGSCACASRTAPVVGQQPAGRHRRGRSCQETWTRSLLGPQPRAPSASLFSSWEAVLVPQRT